MDISENYENVLYQLEIESRRSYAEIGRRVGVSKQSVSYAVNSMEDQGIIKGFYPLIDYSKIGFSAYTVLLRLKNFSKKQLRDIEQDLEKNYMTAWVDTVSGGWDLAVYFVAPNTSKFNKKFKLLLSNNSTGIKDYKVMSSVVVHEMGRKYLRDYSLDDEIENRVIGGDRQVIELDETMQQVLDELNKDPKKPSVQIAQEADVTAKTVADRIDKLRSSKMIRAIRPVLGIQNTTLESKLVFLDFEDQEIEKEDKLKRYCDKHSNVVQLIKLLGEYDMMLRIETDERDVEDVVNNIREQFGEMIDSYESFEVRKRSNISYLPKNYLEISDSI